MAQPLAERSSSARRIRAVVPAALLLLPVVAALAAGCGNAKPPAASPPPVSASASAQPAAPSASTASAPLPADTTPIPPVPPPPVPVSKKATRKSDPAWTACHQSYKARNKDVAVDVAAMAKGCADVTKMKPVGKTIQGKQADQNAPQSYPLAAQAGHCYRVYAQAADGIQDLDVVVKDSAGVIVGDDATDDPSPVVLEDGAICFREADAATVVVSVGMGSGAYAIQVWSD